MIRRLGRIRHVSGTCSGRDRLKAQLHRHAACQFCAAQIEDWLGLPVETSGSRTDERRHGERTHLCRDVKFFDTPQIFIQRQGHTDASRLTRHDKIVQLRGAQACQNGTSLRYFIVIPTDRRHSIILTGARL